MKKGLLTVTLIALAVAAAQAGTYESPFGFTIELPDRWRVVNRERLQKDPAEAHALRGIDRDLLKENEQALLDGKAEIYHNGQRDFIYVQTDKSNMRPYKAFEKQLCDRDVLQKAFSKSFGRPVSVHACAVVRVATYDAVYMDFDGREPGTRSLQYQIWKPSGDTVIVTLTARNEHLRKLRDEFTGMIYSFEVVK